MTTLTTARRLADLDAKLTRAAAEGRAAAKPAESDRVRRYRSSSIRREYR